MNKENRQLFRYTLVLSVIMISGYFLVQSEVGTQWIEILNEGTVEDLVMKIRAFGGWAPLISIALMVLQAFIAPIPAFLITGANGVIFGLFWGVIISWIGAMIGAAGTFYLARILGIDFVKRFEKEGTLVKKVADISQKHGFKVVFIGRLLPFVSFDFLSYAAGLSNLEASKFFIATGIGMLPGTFAYVIFGSQIMKHSGTVNQMLIGFAFILIAVWLVVQLKKRNDRSRKHE